VDPQVLGQEYEAGATIRAIAQHHEMTTLAVWKRLHEANTAMRHGSSKRTTPEVDAEIVSAYRAGKSGPQVAKEFGVALSVVYRRLRVAGVKLRRLPPPAWRARALAESGFTEDEIYARLRDEYQKRFTRRNIRDWLAEDGYVARGTV